MNDNYLHEKILEVKEEFSRILKEYQKSKFALECQDAEYKDSEDNIFEDSGKRKKRGSPGCVRDTRASSRVETGVSGTS